MSVKKRRAHIIGAGISGLTIAYELARRGYEVTVIEKNEVVGGLARTFRYGDFSFDIGPHRFHTDVPRVSDFIKSALGDEWITIERKSSVYLFGKYHKWPLRPSSLVRLPFGALFHCALDLFKRPRFTTERFDDYIKSKYGPTLYEIFFHGYTMKYCWVDPSKMHATWASASIDRAIIDKRASMNTLWDTLKVTLLPKPVTTEFVYPKHGIDVFANRMQAMIEQHGGRVVCGVQDLSLKTKDDRVKSITYDGTKEDVDLLIWTAPITLLAKKLGLKEPQLRYLSLVAFNIEIDHDIGLEDQWIYFPSKELTLCRASYPQNFSPYMVPEGKSAACVEITTLGPADLDYAESKRDSMIQDLSLIHI